MESIDHGKYNKLKMVSHNLSRLNFFNILMVLALFSVLMQFPITLLQSSGKLLEIDLVVHLVTGRCGAGEAHYSFRNFHFLVVGARKEEKEMLV